MRGPDSFRNQRFKLIPRIVEGPWIVRSTVGEIYVVAVRTALLVFLEIKARTRRNTAVTSLFAWQQRRIEWASALYVACYPALPRFYQRFDIMLV